VMLDVMFELPKSDTRRKVIITKDCIEDGATPKIIELEDEEKISLDKEDIAS